MSTRATTRVQEIGFAVPLLPGKTDTDRGAMLSCWRGERKAAHAASRERLDITRESVWLQSSAEGDIAVVHLEARDVDATLRAMATSDAPFDRWFREHVIDVHGIDLADPLPPLEQVLEFRR